MKLLISSIFIISISYLSTALKHKLGESPKGALPYSCGDGSPFGAPYNCNLPPSYPKDRRKDENTVRIMQFNGDSLFLEGCASWDQFEPRIPSAKTPVGAMTHLQSVANTIYRLNADIIIIDEVCDCCILRELIRHMNRNHISQTYQEYMLQTEEWDKSGEHVGIITRIDPIDIWHSDSRPKQLKSRRGRNGKRRESKLDKQKRRESDLPPPPLPMDNTRRLMIQTKGTNTKPVKPANPAEKAKKVGDKKKTVANGKRLKPPPKPLDKNGNKLRSKKKTVKGLRPPPEPPKMNGNIPSRIREREYLPNPEGSFKHIAASFNLHLDKPVTIIGAQFADFAENNERIRKRQAKDLAKFVKIYRRDYHIIVVGDFNSVPEGQVLNQFAEDTDFINIGYKYYDKDDFTYLSQLSMGMLDNIFVSPAMFEKVQDTKIDYSHPKPIWPFSNHLPIIIDLDTTWYGGWGGIDIQKPPKFKSILNEENNGEQKAVDKEGYGIIVDGGQDDEDHTNYKKEEPKLIDESVNVPAQDQMPEPPQPAANDNDYGDYEEYGDYGYYEEERDDIIDYKRYRAERKDKHYEIIGKDDIADSVATENWLETVLKWMVYVLIGTVCLGIGGCIGWIFVGFWKKYKGTVVHVNRFGQ